MENFIKKVKQCPCLWDMNHMSYRDIGMKDSVWKRIAKECGMANGKAAKNEWKKIRDSHREAMRRRKTSTGQAAHNFKPWKYEAQMDFLLPQAENKPSCSNVSNDSQSTHDTVDALEPNTRESPSSAPVPSLPTPRSTQSEKRTQIKLDTETAILQQRQKRREKKQSDRDEQRRRVVDTNRTQQDALSNLFTSFCQKTRELPKYLQLRVQREIFDSVTRAEEEAMSFDSRNARLSPTSSSASSYNQNSFLPDASPVTQPSPTYASSPIPDVSLQNQSSYVYAVIKQEEDP